MLVLVGFVEPNVNLQPTPKAVGWNARLDHERDGLMTTWLFH